MINEILLNPHLKMPLGRGYLDGGLFIYKNYDKSF